MIIVYFLMSVIASIFIIFIFLLIFKYSIYLFKKYILGTRKKEYKKLKFNIYSEIFENSLLEKYFLSKIKKS